MSRHTFEKNQGGFTLIEVMLVIAIMAIMASLIVMNLQGVEHRRVMQAKEALILDLQKIRLEAFDQGRILGLVVLPATDVSPTNYQVVEFVPERIEQNNVLMPNIIQPKKYRWQIAPDFKSKNLPDHTNLVIQMIDTSQNLERLKQNQQNLPQVIWLGNGEVLPARFQFFLQQQAIGDAIEINRLGVVVQNELS